MKKFITRAIIFVYLLVALLLMCCEELCILGAGMLILFLIIAQGGLRTFWKRLWSDK